jgi:ribosomal protein L12E/L44/L45/RPP1/RPP2
MRKETMWGFGWIAENIIPLTACVGVVVLGAGAAVYTYGASAVMGAVSSAASGVVSGVSSAVGAAVNHVYQYPVEVLLSVAAGYGLNEVVTGWFKTKNAPADNGAAAKAAEDHQQEMRRKEEDNGNLKEAWDRSYANEQSLHAHLAETLRTIQSLARNQSSVQVNEATAEHGAVTGLPPERDGVGIADAVHDMPTPPATGIASARSRLFNDQQPIRVADMHDSDVEPANNPGVAPQ